MILRYSAKAKDRKSPHSHHYNQDPGAVHPPKPIQFIRIWTDTLRDPKPKDRLDLLFISTINPVNTDTLYKELEAKYGEISVVAIPVKLAKGNTLMFIHSPTRPRFGELEQDIRQIIEANAD